jgi:alkane 1-monooxygenase
MDKFKYALAYVSIGIGVMGLLFDGWVTWALVIYGFGLIPLIELFVKGSKENRTAEQEEKALNDRVYDFLVYSIVPLQYGLVVLFLFSIQRELLWWELAGKVMTLGMACGVFGINVGHELGHRLKKSEQWMAKALLLTSQYMHFFIEHNRGHHNRVSTQDDPASSRFNEPVYIFWFRSMVMGYFSAWHLEQFRLSKLGKLWWHYSNEMIHYTLIQAAFLGIIAAAFNVQTMFLYWAAAIVGILLLETVNYIEHYGLGRHKGEVGYHKVLPIHSWNSNHELGRGILFELSRHSDHHFRANRKYQILRYHEASPQMPTGYPGMMVLSLFPPLWFAVMNPRVRALQEQYPEKMAANSWQLAG